MKILLIMTILFLVGCENSMTEGTYVGTAIDTYGGEENTAKALITIDETGKITDVELDVSYTKDGVVTSKKELGDSYGMKEGNSDYGFAALEWYEQIELLEKAVIENQGIDFITMDESGKTDAVSGCTVQIEPLYNAIEEALKKAK